MRLPNNAMDFVHFMEDIWDMDGKPTEDGGTVLYQHPDYSRYHNALRVARFCGMIRTGGSSVGDKNAHVFRFPDEMYTGVCIAADGSALRPARRYGPKKEKLAQ